MEQQPQQQPAAFSPSTKGPPPPPPPRRGSVLSSANPITRTDNNNNSNNNNNNHNIHINNSKSHNINNDGSGVVSAPEEPHIASPVPSTEARLPASTEQREPVMSLVNTEKQQEWQQQQNSVNMQEQHSTDTTTAIATATATTPAIAKSVSVSSTRVIAKTAPPPVPVPIPPTAVAATVQEQLPQQSQQQPQQQPQHGSSSTSKEKREQKERQKERQKEKMIEIYQGLVIRAYHAVEDDELTVRLNDTVQVLKEFDDGWLLCQLVIQSTSTSSSNTPSSPQPQHSQFNSSPSPRPLPPPRKQLKTLGLVPREHVERVDNCSSISNSNVRVPIRKGSLFVLKQKLDLEAVFKQGPSTPPQAVTTGNSQTAATTTTTTALPPPSTPPSHTKPSLSSSSPTTTPATTDKSSSTPSPSTTSSSKSNILTSLLSKKRSNGSIQMSQVLSQPAPPPSSTTTSPRSNSIASPPVPSSKPNLRSVHSGDQQSMTQQLQQQQQDSARDNLSRILMMNPKSPNNLHHSGNSASGGNSTSSSGGGGSTIGERLSLDSNQTTTCSSGATTKQQVDGLYRRHSESNQSADVLNLDVHQYTHATTTSPGRGGSSRSSSSMLNTLDNSMMSDCQTSGTSTSSSGGGDDGDSTCTSPLSPTDTSSSSSSFSFASHDNDQQLLQVQQMIESHLARSEGKTEQIREMANRRKKIRLEILETEQTYVHCLTLQRNMFAKLIKMLKLVPDDVYKQLFPTSLDIIFDINVSFLDYLKKVITTMPSMAFGAEQMRNLLSKMALDPSEMTDEIKRQCLEGALREISMINSSEEPVSPLSSSSSLLLSMGNGGGAHSPVTSSSSSSSPVPVPVAPLTQNEKMSRSSFEIDPYQSQSTQLASLILHYAHTFKLYTDYINKYPVVISVLIQEKARNKKFADFLNHQRLLLKQQGERCCMLEDFLITPIQRLPRYRLLFEDLMKHTEKDHESYQKLEMAVNLITDIAKFCNDKEEEHLNQVTMATLLKRYKIKEFLQPGRKILMRFESQTDVQYLKSNGSRGECDLYLLSDAILLAKSKNSLSNKKNCLQIQLTKVGALLEKRGTVSSVQVSSPEQVKLDQQTFHSFRVVTNYSESKAQKMTLLFKSEDTMNKAYQSLQQHATTTI